MSSTNDMDAHVDFAGIHALSSRGAGYSVAAKCLQVQADAEAHDPSLRSAKGVTLHADAWSWYVGALGEIEVGEILKALGPEWFVRHAVPIGAGTKDVDHLVIGPGGVFAINTKHHADASIWVGDFVLRVNNANTHHMKQAQSDGRDVARRLTAKVGFPVRVTSVLAILDAKSIVDKRPSNNRPVAVIDANQLTGWLVGRAQLLSDTQLALIKLAAEEPETWHIDPRAADTLRVMQRFERLAAQVGMPVAPTQGPSRTRSQPRASRRAPSRVYATSRRSLSRSSGRTKPSFGALLKLWFSVGLIVTAILVFRSIANQPCTTPLACIVPPLYLGFKPLLVFGAIAAVGFGAVGTMFWLVRRVSR
jgi:hypothetical protein